MIGCRVSSADGRKVYNTIWGLSPRRLSRRSSACELVREQRATSFLYRSPSHVALPLRVAWLIELRRFRDFLLAARELAENVLIFELKSKVTSPFYVSRADEGNVCSRRIDSLIASTWRRPYWCSHKRQISELANFDISLPIDVHCSKRYYQRKCTARCFRRDDNITRDVEVIFLSFSIKVKQEKSSRS